MKIFECRQCTHPIYFDNTACGKCGSSLGFLSSRKILSALVQREDGWEIPAYPQGRYHYCRNHRHNLCNWLVPANSIRPLCRACELNRTVPISENPEHFKAWKHLETAKHRLVYELLRLRLPVQSKSENPETGLAFDFLLDYSSISAQQGVLAAHVKGVITVNLAEADLGVRERNRNVIGESAGTLIGNFRHEIGHYYWEIMVQPDAELLEEFRELFGDERADYSQAMQHYHQAGPPQDWQDRFLSVYGAAHPWEDWAETWAHYLHMADSLETAHADGVRVRPDMDVSGINRINRKKNRPDLYPFVLPPPALEKLRFVHQLIRRR